MVLLVILSLAFVRFPLSSSALVPVQAVDEASVGSLHRGIDRICNETSFNEIVLVYNDDLAQYSLLGSRLYLNRPVIVRGSNFSQKIIRETCFVSLLSSNKVSKVLEKHIETYAVSIVVLPHEALEAVQKLADAVDKCLMYYFLYDEVTLAGSWIYYRNGVSTHSMEAIDPISSDLQGQIMRYMNFDPSRDLTYDLEIGRTIAQRHNGTFESVQQMLGCFDYIYNPVMSFAIGRFATLPEMFQMCFVVPRSKLKSIFSILLDPFDYISWAVFALTIAVISLVLSQFGETFRRYNVAIVSLELMMSAINGPSHRYEGRFEMRIIGLFLLMNIVLLSCYQSLVISFMSSARYEPELDTMEQINDTCYLQYDVFLAGMGYRFKNTFQTFELYGTSEKMWRNKMCFLLTCNDVNSGHTSMQIISIDFDYEMKDFSKYFRFSKANLRSAPTMYTIFNHSPMRDLILRYTAWFFEGHLHHLPMLHARKIQRSLREENDQQLMTVVAMSVEDLLIVWTILLIGCVASGLAFLIELAVTYIPILWWKVKTKIRAIWQGLKRRVAF